MKILAVDDEKIVLDCCKRVLEAEGFEVFLATSVEQAQKAMEGEKFSLFLIDIKMPGLDGMHLMREVKKRCMDIPVVIMSGYHTNEAIEEIAKWGDAILIPKPFTPDELLKTVSRVLKRR